MRLDELPWLDVPGWDCDRTAALVCTRKDRPHSTFHIYDHGGRYNVHVSHGACWSYHSYVDALTAQCLVIHYLGGNDEVR